MGFTAKWDGDRCPVCHNMIMQGDEIEIKGEMVKHTDCSVAEDGSLDPPTSVQWDVSAESIDRMTLEDLEERRIAPLARQGKCPVCFIELPATRICDDHGMVRA
jgi:hypothetical protein